MVEKSSPIIIDKKNARLVAHRGLSGIETENTAASFIAAANRSYYGIETDVYVTADGRYVCIHNNHTVDVSDEDVDVTKAAYEEVKAVRIRDNSRGAGERRDLSVPDLEDYLSICKKYGKRAVLELKQDFSPANIAEICDIAKNIGILDETTFISFYPQNIEKVKNILPSQDCQLLTIVADERVDEYLKRLGCGLDVLYTALKESDAARIKKLGAQINCWTVDDPAAAEKLIGWGVDYITTNILE